MVGHSHKWNDEASIRKISNDGSDGIAAITNKLDSLGRDMKKLKESVHAIQVGCDIYEGMHLTKECPLEEGKTVEEVKYGEFGRPFQGNGGNGARYQAGPQGESTNLNLKNQDDAIKSLDAKVGQLAKYFQAKITGSAPITSTYVNHCKAIFTNDGLPLYTPFGFSIDNSNDSSSVSFVSNKEMQKIKEVIEVKEDPVPRHLPIVNHYVEPYVPPIPFREHLKRA
uniref:Uncharacterized protein n=1 Tax=Tanacetum cinerariifolium TaxID=118510 RepID=A0A6L2LY63_TANCI|nr:hypothetical protein [Tanacetum cinerariifolium]